MKVSYVNLIFENDMGESYEDLQEKITEMKKMTKEAKTGGIKAFIYSNIFFSQLPSALIDLEFQPKQAQ